MIRAVAKQISLVAILILAANPAKSVAGDEQKFNVLFIAIDDLRPELGCYGNSQIKSPNIDALAKQGLQFNRAYCQVALCNPSRASLLTSRRPESIQVYDLETFVRTHAPTVVTLPQLFKNSGYEARSVGKIFHVTNGNHEDDVSWSARPWQSPKSAKPAAKNKQTDVDANGKAVAKPDRTKSGKRGVGAEPFEPRANVLPYESPDVADNQLLDGQIADRAA